MTRLNGPSSYWLRQLEGTIVAMASTFYDPAGMDVTLDLGEHMQMAA